MTSAENVNSSSSGTSGANKLSTPQTPVLTVSCRMLRSPSHESVTTDLSLFSVSSIASDALARGMRLVSFKSYNDTQLAARGPSPNPESRERTNSSRPADIPEILWFEEENDLIKSCAALSSALGLQKSFSTSDISQLPSPDDGTGLDPASRCAVSELALNSLQRSSFIIDHPRLDHASRSCSTWVAVGDMASTSQLPSPHGGQTTSSSTVPPQPNTPPPPHFTAADLVRSVNKKLRQNYIRRRLLTTYRALERLSQSEFNLDRLEVNVTKSMNQSLIEKQASGVADNSTDEGNIKLLNVPGANVTTTASGGNSTNSNNSSPSMHINFTNAAVLRAVKQRNSRNLPLTIRDVERERGKPLSKYERNMMIFNWLHTLDDSAFEGLQ